MVVKCGDQDLTDTALRDKVERHFERAIPSPAEWLFTWDTSISTLKAEAIDPASLEAQRKRIQRRLSDDMNSLISRPGKDPTLVEVTEWIAEDQPLPRQLSVTFGTLSLDDPRKIDQIEDGFDQAVNNRWPHARALFDWRHGAITELDITLVAHDDPEALQRTALTRFRNVTQSKFGNSRNAVTTEVLEWQDVLSANGTALPQRARVNFGTVDVTKPDTKDSFQDHWDSIDDSNDWSYEWNTPEGFVEMVAVPKLARALPFPNPDEELHDFFVSKFRSGKIVLGPQKGGGWFVWDLNKVPHGLIGGRTGAGKAAAVTTPIFTSTGWRTLGDLTVGDSVFDENGQPCAVTGVFDQPLSDSCFEVEFSDGSTVVASDDHLWWTEDRSARLSRSGAPHTAAREPWLSPQRVAVLREQAACATPDATVTIPEVAQLAGVDATSQALHMLAKSIGPARERREVMREYHYRTQSVAQRQRVRVFDSPALCDWIEGQVRGPKFAASQMAQHRDALLALCTHYRRQTTVTAADFARGLGLAIRVMRNWLEPAAGVVSNSVELRMVTLDVPEKTVQRLGPPVALYPKQALLDLVADYGEAPTWDQRSQWTIGQVRTTCEIRHSLRTPSGHANHSVPVCKPLQFPTADLPIAPYTLGAWLGDGSSWHAEITTMDPEVIARIAEDGYPTTLQALTPSEPVRAGHARRYRISKLASHLRASGLCARAGGVKHIPPIYFTASEEQRRQLLAGLLDIDGTVCDTGSVEFASTDEQLARDVCELARGLGYGAVMRSKAAKLAGVECGTCWTVSFSTADKVFGLYRKQRSHDERRGCDTDIRSGLRYIVDIRKVEMQPMRCISVDSPTRQFLIGDALIPTHNSVQLDIILYLILLNRDMSSIVVCDPKMTDFTWTAEYPNVIQFAAGVEDICTAIDGVYAEMQRRQRLLNKRGVRNIAYLRKLYEERPDLLAEDGGTMPGRIFLLFDEIANFLGASANKDVEELKDDARTKLESIGQLSRAMWINMIVAAQKPEAKYVSTQLKQMMELRVCVGPVDEYTSKQILESNHGTRFGEGTPKGRAWAWTSEQGFQVVQVPYLPSATEPAPWDPSITIEGSRERLAADLEANGWHRILEPNADGGQDGRWVRLDESPALQFAKPSDADTERDRSDPPPWARDDDLDDDKQREVTK